MSPISIPISFSQSVDKEVYEAVCHAIDLGYRHFDTAYFYQNEGLIGNAFKDKIEEGVVTRDDLFITTKVSGCDNLL